ncbi:MAG: 16S rRNA (guanine(966)-N(2))-methyltransferase RsmD [Bdellovibrionales bacterium]|nr:16S rRNA (guanine(966)-N(2))-methyltransferase RsmD [Bdellovibrionales bacterium]
MRIVGGQWGGRTLFSPSGDTTRPTTDSLREAIFNMFDHSFGHAPNKVLDLFAGTGALAFESLSRGAASAVLVEADRKALAAIRKNQEALGLGADIVRIVEQSRVESWARALLDSGQAPFDTIFCDPPYDKGLVRKALVTLEIVGAQLFAPEALLVAETSIREPALTLPHWELLKERRKGSTATLFYRRVAP